MLRRATEVIFRLLRFIVMKLILIHGRSQEDKDPDVLRHKWVSALRAGAEAGGLEVPICEEDILFPYFGDALRDLTTDEESIGLAHIAVAEPHFDDLEFRCRVLNDCLDGAGVSEQMVSKELEPHHRAPGPLSREWVQKGLALLDRHVPGASARSLAWTAEDVAQYLQNEDVRGYIEDGVARAFRRVDDDEEVVVIGHSLGSIIAYSMLREGGRIDRPVKALITIGSPLGVTAIRQALGPISHPPHVASWFNAYDVRDSIALVPLDKRNFDVQPSIKNYGGVENDSYNHHSISGYLSDRAVATKIIKELRTSNRELAMS